MFSHRDQLEILKNISIQDGERKTLDCPFCGGRRKFSITKVDGRLLWNCFRASCTAKGSHQGQRSIEAIKTRLQGATPMTQQPRVTPLPSITTSIVNHKAAVSYVTKNNCMEAYMRGYINIRFAPAEQRVLFYTADGKGAVGRSLQKNALKWWSYGNLNRGFKIGIGDVYVYVEDVPSACSISRLDNHVGVAMLGTSYVDHADSITSAKRRVIVLDNDASSKAFSIARSVGDGATVRLTKADLKTLSPEEIQTILEPVIRPAVDPA